MATYGSTLRRGLPRVPGGEPWPPGTFVPAVALAAGAGAPSGAGATGNAAVVPPPRHEPEVPSGNGAAVAADAGAARADVAATGVGGAVDAPSAGAAAVAAAVVAPAVAPAEGPARAIRRGLPRVPGGEPWPPASFAASASSAAPASAASASAVAPVASAARASDAPVAVPVAAPVSGTVPNGRPESKAPARNEDAGAPASGAEAPVLRRGLPRTTGGEPWPPASFVPRVPAASSPGAVPQGLQESEAPSGDEGAVATPAATAVTPDAAAAEAVVAAPAAPAAAAAAGSAAAGPLPFTPTVFPTASSTRWSALRAERAGKGPLPAPEPARIGPFTRGQWAGAVVVGGLGLLFAAAMLVLVVRWLVSLGPVQDFLATYPGEYHLPEGAPVGLPAWIGWQHFFNVFLMVLIIRSGLQVRREKRPAAFWSPRRDKKRKISLNLWFHQALDILWLVNGVVFVVLLFATGQWMRIIPTSWEVFPNALSAALQYVSLDWPTENGWVNYNALQQLAYFATVFLAAPLAAVTGVRMSGVWPKNAKALNKAYPVEWARAVHFPVMIYFVLFIVVHVTLVLATGALRNLNHMYAAQDVVNWAGFWIFAASLVVIAAGWVAARPLVIAPIARLFGSVSSR